MNIIIRVEDDGETIKKVLVKSDDAYKNAIKRLEKKYPGKPFEVKKNGIFMYRGIL